MLAFVHRMPCRDDDISTVKDLSKVRKKEQFEVKHTALAFGSPIKHLVHLK